MEDIGRAIIWRAREICVALRGQRKVSWATLQGRPVTTPSEGLGAMEHAKGYETARRVGQRGEVYSETAFEIAVI